MTNRSRVALITGSGRRRIGNAIATHLATKGFDIALHYRTSMDAASETCEAIKNIGVRCQAYQADVRNQTEVDQMIDQVRGDFDQIDALVTTASTWECVPLEDVTVADLRDEFDVNAIGTFLPARAAGLIMTNQTSGGAIVTIGDWAIDRPYIDHAPYFLAKGAIPTLTRVLAIELGHRNPNVRVNCIHPGPVLVPHGTSDEDRSALIASTLLKKVDQPEAVASAVEFLIDNPFITGACLPVDGGSHIYSPDGVTRERAHDSP